MKKRVFSFITLCMILLSMSSSVLSHSGRTDSSGGHRDNKNKSGLGSYHYHCGGYPPHLHNGGVCPYKGGSSSGSSSYSSGSSSLGSSSYSSGGSSSGGSSYSSGGSAATAYSYVPKTIYASKILISNFPETMYVGESIILKPSVYPSNAEDKSVSLKSENTEIADITYSGKLTAMKAGTTYISAKTNRGTTSKFKLTVKNVEAEEISIEGKKEKIKISDTLNLSVVFIPENTTEKDVNWISDNEDIVSVDEEGNLVALSQGKTTISAVHKELTDSFDIEVEPIEAERISISCIEKSTGDEYSELKFEAGTNVEFTACVLPENTTDATVIWSVDNPDVATIDENGKLYALKKGNVTVTAKTTNNLCASADVEIFDYSFVTNIVIIAFALMVMSLVIAIPVLVILFVIKKIKKGE